MQQRIIPMLPQHLRLTFCLKRCTVSFEQGLYKKNKDVFIIKEKNKSFLKFDLCFAGIYMQKRLTFPSDSATPQTPCLSTFRLKDMHCEMISAGKYLFRKRFPKNRER